MRIDDILRSARRHVPTLAAVVMTLLPACRQPPPPPVQPADFETPAAAEVLREVMQEAKDTQQAPQVGVIVLGPQLQDSTPEFRAQFTDSGLQWFSSENLTNVWVGPVARVIEKTTKLQPLQLQLFSVEKLADGAEEIVAAWAFEDKMVRRRYRATAQSGGGWSIQPLEIVEEKKGVPSPFAPPATEP